MSGLTEFGTCRTCRFWQAEAEGEGTCQRYAPRPVFVERYAFENEMIVLWPNTVANDACGEHLGRP